MILRWSQLPVITGVTFIFTFHMRCMSTVRYFHHHHHNNNNLTCLIFELSTLHEHVQIITTTSSC